MSVAAAIVYPLRPGLSHLHTFFGNSDVSGTTSTADLGNLANFGRSTCAGGLANRSAYWVPAMVKPVPAPLTGRAEAIDDPALLLVVLLRMRT